MIQVKMPAVIEATKAAIMTIKEAYNSVNNARLVHRAWRLGNLALKQPMFDWKMADKYQELCNFETEAKTIS